MTLVKNNRDLETLLVLVDSGSFTEAARVLDVSQPAVSQAIRRLECQLGAELVVRRRFSHAVELTRAGELVHRRAKAIRDEFDALDQELGALRASHRIRVGLPPIIMNYYFGGRMDALDAFVEAEPVTILTFGSELMLSEIRAGRLDVGVVAATETELRVPGVATERIASFPFDLVVRGTDPLARISRIDAADLPALVTAPFVTFTNDFLQRKALEDLAARTGMPLSIASETNQLDNLEHLIETGAGIGFLTAMIASADPPGVHRLAVVGPGVPRFNVFLYRRTCAAAGGDDVVEHVVTLLRDAARRAET
ncbi:LysR family transcriptional regulator [Neoactinobaculum massilliense]|uniref:LysR family transcriptional regulator n=1 Tax=Neoactinobaculum massilliense TaxID=2364794 RepID=UPI0013DE5A95|nr:LysR family transcriptional regulator [Neoactinobaculum massilliense]